MKMLLACFALGIVLIFSGCGASNAQNVVVKETVVLSKHKTPTIAQKKHKHHRHHKRAHRL